VTGAALGVAAVATIVGAAAFCCLAYAVSTIVGNAEPAAPVAQFATLPCHRQRRQVRRGPILVVLARAAGPA
jgi:hypothetical protein